MFWGGVFCGKVKAESDNLVFAKKEGQERKIKAPNKEQNNPDLSGPVYAIEGSEKRRLFLPTCHVFTPSQETLSKTRGNQCGFLVTYLVS